MAALDTRGGAPLRVRLVPYGCTRIRVSAFPWHVEDSKEQEHDQDNEVVVYE